MIWRVTVAAFLTLCLAAIGQAPRAQFNGCQAGFCAPQAVGGGGYTGILDIANIPTVVMSFGSHCPKSSYTGNLFDVYSISLATTKATVGCSSGGVIVVKSGTWTLGQVQSGCTAAHDCVAIKLYDTSAALACTAGTACDMTMTAATGPYLVTADGTSTCGSGATFANLNTFCLQTNLSSGVVAPVSGALTAGISQPIVYLFTYATLSAGGQADLVYNTGNTVRTLSDIGSSPNLFSIFSGGSPVTITATEAQWHTAFSQFNGASSCTAIDNGSCTTTTSGSGTIASSDTIGFANNVTAADKFFGFFGDIYIFSTTITGVQATVYANEKAFWGGGMP